MNSQEYIDRHFDILKKYIDDVTFNDRISGDSEKLAVLRYKRDLKRDDLIMRKDKVEHFLKFLFYIRINIKGRYSRLFLSPFQMFIITNLYGFYWKHKEKRRYRYAYIQVARKNGKTTLNAILSLYHMTIGAEKDAECILTAPTSKQSNIALERTKSIINNSPALRKRIIRRQYYLKTELKGSKNFLHAFAFNPDKMDGFSPSYALLDEVHEMINEKLFNVVKSGILARQNPLVVLITTAGFNLDSFCHEYYELNKRLLKGEIQDDSLFTIIFEMDEGDDWEDENNWYKANPNLGVIIDIDDLKIEYKQAKNKKTEQTNFKTKHLNDWCDSLDSWIEDEHYHNCFDDYDADFSSVEWKTYCGVDLSSQRDLTSVVFVHYNSITNLTVIKPYFFFPLNEKIVVRKSGIDLQRWIDAEHIIQIDKPYIDEDDIFDFIKEKYKEHGIEALGYDPWNAGRLVGLLKMDPEMGFYDDDKEDRNLIGCPQTVKFFNMPMKYAERYIIDEQISMSTNPVLRWNFRNVVIYRDGNGNTKPMKNKSADSIDGVMALLNGMGVMLASEFNEAKMESEMLRRYRETL